MGWGSGSEGHRDNGNDYLWAGGVGLRDTETMVMITYGQGGAGLRDTETMVMITYGPGEWV